MASVHSTEGRIAKIATEIHDVFPSGALSPPIDVIYIRPAGFTQFKEISVDDVITSFRMVTAKISPLPIHVIKACSDVFGPFICEAGVLFVRLRKIPEHV